MIIRYCTIIFLLFCLTSCKRNNEKNIVQVKPDKNRMADLNKYLVQKDRERIINYIERKNLKMTESPTGLWYLIKKEGTGNFLSDNDQLSMEYECSLLDGTNCYSSKILGPKEIILGKSKLEPGLNEGLRMLKSGAEAYFILPPFLAYGLIGDGKKIPSKAVIIYNVNILRSKK
jgi:FKBP-type peptidyl-prolyl cis-trans isomerase FkpA